MFSAAVLQALQEMRNPKPHTTKEVTEAEAREYLRLSGAEHADVHIGMMKAGGALDAGNGVRLILKPAESEG